MIANAVGEPNAEAALANYEKHEAHYKEFSAYNHVSKGDPPLLMTYGSDMTLPSKKCRARHSPSCLRSENEGKMR